ncbi:MAG: hypothetical protein K0S88_6297 [Actinomycetia bacterium]|nr:hypothetical protein [Actinomycetes bacterium]
MADNWFVGNAVAYGQGDNRGWLIGHFLDGSAGVRSSEAVEVKWGIHPAGDNREAWQTGEQRTTGRPNSCTIATAIPPLAEPSSSVVASR